MPATTPDEQRPDPSPQPTPPSKSSRTHWGPLVVIAALLLGGGYGVNRWLTRPTSPGVISEPTVFDRDALNAPYITTGHEVVAAMVEMAELNADDLVYDLGCGDGRLVIAAALQGCRGVGIDIDPERIAEARENAKRQGVDHLVEFREQDVFTVDLSEADVVLMYLLPWMTKRLIPEFQEMPPGARIISHDFGLGEIIDLPADDSHLVVDPTDQTRHVIYRWNLPLKVPATEP